ncbi:MAG: hypothetical protein ACC634_02175, partial [Hyphomicrobiales bacterium]
MIGIKNCHRRCQTIQSPTVSGDMPVKRFTQRIDLGNIGGNSGTAKRCRDLNRFKCPPAVSRAGMKPLAGKVTGANYVRRLTSSHRRKLHSRCDRLAGVYRINSCGIRSIDPYEFAAGSAYPRRVLRHTKAGTKAVQFKLQAFATLATFQKIKAVAMKRFEFQRRLAGNSKPIRRHAQTSGGSDKNIERCAGHFEFIQGGPELSGITRLKPGGKIETAF